MILFSLYVRKVSPLNIFTTRNLITGLINTDATRITVSRLDASAHQLSLGRCLSRLLNRMYLREGLVTSGNKILFENVNVAAKKLRRSIHSAQFGWRWAANIILNILSVPELQCWISTRKSFHTCHNELWLEILHLIVSSYATLVWKIIQNYRVNYSVMSKHVVNLSPWPWPLSSAQPNPSMNDSMKCPPGVPEIWNRWQGGTWKRMPQAMPSLELSRKKKKCRKTIKKSQPYFQYQTFLYQLKNTNFAKCMPVGKYIFHTSVLLLCLHGEFRVCDRLRIRISNLQFITGIRHRENDKQIFFPTSKTHDVFIPNYNLRTRSPSSVSDMNKTFSQRRDY